MKLSLSVDDLARCVGRQMATLFPDTDDPDPVALRAFTAAALERVEHGFSRVRLKYFHDGTGPVFNHRNTDQYAIFLYYLSNTIFRRAGEHPLAEKAYALNKALHGLDAFYQVELPDIFIVVHPLGTVLGRARYGDYFCVYQGCTVGANLNDVYPEIGRGVVMYGGSRLIGRCRIGDNTLLSAGASVIDTDVAGNCIVFGQRPLQTLRPTRRDVLRDVFKVDR